MGKHRRRQQKGDQQNDKLVHDVLLGHYATVCGMPPSGLLRGVKELHVYSIAYNSY
jgi:hypothetical protein